MPTPRAAAIAIIRTGMNSVNMNGIRRPIVIVAIPVVAAMVERIPRTRLSRASPVVT
jgi:hypothetical protein